MPAWLSLAISCFAFGVSVITAWLTFFRKGRLAMTQPTTVFLGPDGPMFDLGKNKVYLRTLLYSTAKRGHVLESLYLTLHRNDSKQNFNVWVYGEKGDLQRGSGLFVPQEGVTFNHHFLLPEDGANFAFLQGAYTLSVFARLVGQWVSTELVTIRLSISESQAQSLSQPRTGIYFDYSPDQQSYHAHLQHRPRVDPEQAKLLQMFRDKGVEL
ncbi:MAG: hypothetical protein JF606_22125 [Burkholderiales bacterium]|nr:hypothetical protein [Burkholderiales bacterium]